MEGMSEEQLKEALDHDEARRESAGGNGAEEVVVQNVVPTVDLVEALDLKLAYLAKAVSLAYIDAARACVGLAMQEVSPVVDLSGDPKEAPRANPERVDALMNMGERASRIACALDVLGDKSLVRAELGKPEDGPQ